MTVPSLASAIGAKIVAAAPTTEPFDPQVRPSEHADLQANGVMALAGRLRLNPRDLAGWLPSTVDARHVPFGTVLGADGKPFKTRAGETVKLVGLLDAAVERARSFDGDRADAVGTGAVADAVGIGAVKYFELSTNRVRDYAFDLDRMVSLTGDTGVYLQYAHARLRSILARAPEDLGVDPALPLAPEERRLILQLDRFGDIVVAAVAAAEPHQVCGYLARLAQTLTAFYGACPVLRAEPAVRRNRLALCRLTADTVRLGLDLLGIAAPVPL
jgi:arginyl-tRNA synthetase